MIGKIYLDLLASKASKKSSLGDFPKASRLYETIVKRDPLRQDVWLKLANNYLQAGNTQKALHTLERAKARFPANYQILFLAGEIYLQQSDKFNSLINFYSAYEHQRSSKLEIILSNIVNTRMNFGIVYDIINQHFSPSYYLSRYNDVANSKLDPLLHFLLYGWKEGRIGSRSFNAALFAEMQANGQVDILDIPLVAYHQNLHRYGSTGILDGEPWLKATLPSDNEWLALPAAVISEKTEAVVIIPVYKGYEETLMSVYHALQSKLDRDYALLVINDCGPDKLLNDSLVRLASLGLFEYVANNRNIGFVQTVNLAIRHHSGNFDVVLLNSDAFVFPGWFDRLLHHAIDPKVATITPFTNNGTICSYPLMNFENEMPLEISPSQLDKLAASTNRHTSIEAPTGVGFCFFMRRAVIEEIGAFDEVSFKVGYGEECDFCMRALNAGYKNRIATDIFVYHIGSVSFSAIKETNFAAGQQALQLNHPNYSFLVEQHIKANPALPMRQKLDVARLALCADNPVIFITHGWGGGIKKFLDVEQQRLREKSHQYIELKVENLRFLSLSGRSNEMPFTPNLRNIDLSTQSDLVLEIFKSLKPSVIHVNSFAGLDWHHHKALIQLIMESGVAYKYTCHDYSCFSPHFQLMRPDGVYCGVPNIEDRKIWATMTVEGITDLCDPVDRQATYFDFFKRAKSVDVPSGAALKIISNEFPQIDLTLTAHSDFLHPNKIAKIKNVKDFLHIAIVGAIGLHKGSQLILALARDASNRELPIKFTIIGYSDIDSDLAAAGVEILGQYTSDEQAIEAIGIISPDFIFIPSVWPETYCYTLSFAFHLAIPAITFSLGAQGERNSAEPGGIIIDERMINSPRQIMDVLMRLHGAGPP